MLEWIVSNAGIIFPRNKFPYTAVVATTFKGIVKVCLDQVGRIFRIRVKGSDTKDVRVVVTSGQHCFILVMNDRCPDAFHLVGGNAHPDTRGTAQNPCLGPPAGHVIGDKARVIGIVDRISGIGSVVDHLVALAGKEIEDGCPELNGSMIERYADFHLGNVFFIKAIMEGMASARLSRVST